MVSRGPVSYTHLSSEAGSAQQVEDHEDVSGDRGEAGSNLGPDLVAVVRQLVSIVIQNTEGTDDIPVSYTHLDVYKRQAKI